MLRLTVGQVSSAALPAAPTTLLLEAVGRVGVQAADAQDLLHRLDEIAQQVRAIFIRHVGELVL
jgi:[glutamine synthetase] adenylyltransferase / [glutamine synthetase]-adenylyl-L-tyrosine phosphorylase